MKQHNRTCLLTEVESGTIIEALEIPPGLTDAEAMVWAEVESRRARAIAEHPSDDLLVSWTADRTGKRGAVSPRPGRPEACVAKASDGPAAAVSGDHEPAEPSLLESKQKSVEQPQRRKERPGTFELKRTRCRCRFCEKCAISEGLKTRAKLRKVLITFPVISMVTFTIDPTLCEPARQWFLDHLERINAKRRKNKQAAYTADQIGQWCGPQVMYRYIQERRCIGEWVRSMKAAGHLRGVRYVCVVEWQLGKGTNAGTLMPHYHLLVEASSLSTEAVAYSNQRWGMFRPEKAGPVAQGRPDFGFIKATSSMTPSGRECKRAANYACKYLMKQPEKGWPEWVLNSQGEVKRIWTSKGFYGQKELGPQTDNPGDEQPCCEVEAEDRDQALAAVDRVESTIRERIAKCGKGTVILRMRDVASVDNDPVYRGEFQERFPDVRLETVCEFLGIELPASADRIRISRDEACRVQSQFGVGKFQQAAPRETAYTPGRVHQRQWAMRPTHKRSKEGRAA